MWGAVAFFVVFAHPMPIKQAKKTCIRPFNTNNFNQSLTRNYDNTATESLYRLCD